jgi:hypothetical protein
VSHSIYWFDITGEDEGREERKRNKKKVVQMKERERN